MEYAILAAALLILAVQILILRLLGGLEADVEDVRDAVDYLKEREEEWEAAEAQQRQEKARKNRSMWGDE